MLRICPAYPVDPSAEPVEPSPTLTSRKSARRFWLWCYLVNVSIWTNISNHFRLMNFKSIFVWLDKPVVTRELCVSKWHWNIDPTWWGGVRVSHWKPHFRWRWVAYRSCQARPRGSTRPLLSPSIGPLTNAFLLPFSLSVTFLQRLMTERRSDILDV